MSVSWVIMKTTRKTFQNQFENAKQQSFIEAL